MTTTAAPSGVATALKFMKKQKKKLSDFLAVAQKARNAMSDAEWEEHCRLAQENSAKVMLNLKTDFDAFINSPEGKAREALRVRLEKLIDDPVIKKSDTCVEMLDAFIYCVTYRWGAIDSGAMIEPLAEHFNKVKAAAGGNAKVAADPKQKDKKIVRECWDAWQKEPSRYKNKAKFSKDMLTKFETLESQRVIERWCKEWESSC